MTPEREAQMREMYIKEFGGRPNSAGSYREQDDADEWDVRLSGFLACARALEPKLKDAERYQWLREESGPTLRAAGCLRSDNVLICGKHLDDAIDKAMSAALEDEKNANE